jgi:peptidylprolyl isomerase
MKYSIGVVLLYLFVSQHSFAQSQWLTPTSEKLVYIELKSGTVVIELAPFMTPNHVAQFKKLVVEGFYDGLDFYRVIEGFAAQGGDFPEKNRVKTKHY